LSGIDRALVRKWLDSDAIKVERTKSGERRIPVDEADRIVQNEHERIS
jgi:predicted site-specific integrase-resolvase